MSHPLSHVQSQIEWPELSAGYQDLHRRTLQMDRQSEEMDPAQFGSSKPEQQAPHPLVLQSHAETIAPGDYQPSERVPPDELYMYATLPHQRSLHHSIPSLAKERDLGDQSYFEWWRVQAMPLGRSTQPANPKLRQPRGFRSDLNAG